MLGFTASTSDCRISDPITFRFRLYNVARFVEKPGSRTYHAGHGRREPEVEVARRIFPIPRVASRNAPTHARFVLTVFSYFGQFPLCYAVYVQDCALSCMLFPRSNLQPSSSPESYLVPRASTSRQTNDYVNEIRLISTWT